MLYTYDVQSLEMLIFECYGTYLEGVSVKFACTETESRHDTNFVAHWRLLTVPSVTVKFGITTTLRF